MNSYLVVSLFRTSQYLSFTKSYGQIDINSNNKDLPFETKLLKESFEKHPDKNNLNLDHLLRLRVIIEADSHTEAFYRSRLLFEDALDVLISETYSFSKDSLLRIGFILNLDDFKHQTIEIEKSSMGNFVSHIKQECYPSITEYQYLLNKPPNDFSRTIIRSNYWYRQSALNDNPHLSFLNLWIATETLAKINEDDDITHKIAICLGFPLSGYCNLINRKLLSDLIAIKNYRSWKDFIKNKIMDMRKYRNDIVHRGFRIHELPLEEITLYVSLMSWGYNRMRQYCIDGIYAGLESQLELWEYIPLLIENNDNYVNDVQGNLICMLETNTF